MEPDSWLRLPVPRVDEADLAESESEVTSTQLQRWANETSFADDGGTGGRPLASWLGGGPHDGREHESAAASLVAASLVEPQSYAGTRSNVGGDALVGSARALSFLSAEASPVTSTSAAAVARPASKPPTPGTAGEPPPPAPPDAAPLPPAEFLRVLRRQQVAAGQSPGRGGSAAPPVPSLLDSLLPVIPMASLPRLRASLSTLAVAYRQQELAGVHLQAQLREARAESARLAQEVEAARGQAAEERERAGFLGHALSEATAPASGQAAAEPSLSLAVLRGQALQRAAERIAALSSALVTARTGVAALSARCSDADAVRTAGEVALQEQVARLSAELAQQSVTAEAKIHNAQRGEASARATVLTLQEELARVSQARDAAIADAASVREQLGGASLAAQRFRLASDAHFQRLALAEEAISTLQGMLVEQDAAIAAQAGELQSLRAAKRDAETGSLRGSSLSSLSSSAVKYPLSSPPRRPPVPEAVTSTAHLVHDQRPPDADAAAMPPGAALPAPTVDAVAALSAKVSWLGRHVEQLVHLQQEQQLQAGVEARAVDSARLLTPASAVASEVRLPLVPSALALGSSSNSRPPRPGLDLDASAHGGRRLDPDFRARVEAREAALRSTFDAEVSVAVEATRLEVISRIQGLRDLSSADGQDDGLALYQSFRSDLASRVVADRETGTESQMVRATADTSVVVEAAVDAALSAASVRRVRGPDVFATLSFSDASPVVPFDGAGDAAPAGVRADFLSRALDLTATDRDYAIDRNCGSATSVAGASASAGRDQLDSVIAPGGASHGAVDRDVRLISGTSQADVHAGAYSESRGEAVSEIDPDEEESWTYLLPAL